MNCNANFLKTVISYLSVSMCDTFSWLLILKHWANFRGMLCSVNSHHHSHLERAYFVPVSLSSSSHSIFRPILTQFLLFSLFCRWGNFRGTLCFVTHTGNDRQWKLCYQTPELIIFFFKWTIVFTCQWGFWNGVLCSV